VGFSLYATGMRGVERIDAKADTRGVRAACPHVVAGHGYQDAENTIFRGYFRGSCRESRAVGDEFCERETVLRGIRASTVAWRARC